jgi:hypothetical protein
MQAFYLTWSGGVNPPPGATFRRPGGPVVAPDSIGVDRRGYTLYTFNESLRPHETVEVSARNYYTATVSTGNAVQPQTPLADQTLVYVHLAHRWPYELDWAELAGSTLLDDGDFIVAQIDQNLVSPDVVELVLASELWWWKELNVPDGETGSSWNIHTGALWHGGRQFSDTVGLWAHQVRNGQMLSFRKAKVGGLVSTTYLLGGLERLPPGSRATFRWLRD